MPELAKQVRGDFPILQQKVGTKNLVYLDNGASTQKPMALIDAMSNFYKTSYANIHRGVYELAEQSSLAYEQAREKVANFINCKPKEVVFTKGTTEAINLVAFALSAIDVLPDAQAKQEKQANRANQRKSATTDGLVLKAGDEVLISQMEHHANLIPWQEATKRTGAKLRYIPVTQTGELDLSDIENLLNSKTKLMALTHISNTLGTINPIEQLIEKAHKVGALVLIDGAQAVAHTKLDMQKLEADFYVFSGHKMYAPSGIGVLYGKSELLKKLPAWQTGGDMVESVDFDGAIFADIPHKFEAGTPPIVEAYGLGIAIDYLTNLGMENIEKAERELLNYAREKIRTELPELKIYGEAQEKAGIISFTAPSTGLHPQDLGILLNEYGIAIRTGHHCNIPLLKKLGAGATARISFGLYNTKSELDYFTKTMREIITRFG